MTANPPKDLSASAANHFSLLGSTMRIGSKAVSCNRLELMRTHTIDCARINDENAFWQAYLTATEPEGAGYFGCNLDAFWDALNGGPGWPGECQLNFINTTNLKSLRDGHFYQTLQEIARDSDLIEVQFE